MNTARWHAGDQLTLDGRRRGLRSARAGACYVVPSSTGAAKAVAEGRCISGISRPPGVAVDRRVVLLLSLARMESLIVYGLVIAL